MVIGDSTSCGKCREKKFKPEKIIVSVEDTEYEQWKECFEGRCKISNLGRFLDKELNVVRSIVKYSLQFRDKEYSLGDIIYSSFYGEYDKSQFLLMKIDDSEPIRLDNLFLAKLTQDKRVPWVSRLKTNMKYNGKGAVKITKKDIINKYKEQNGLSYFLKLPMDLSMNSDLLAISIDRMDNTKGYAPDNFTLVTRFENMGRRHNNFEDMQEFAKTYLACNH